MRTALARVCAIASVTGTRYGYAVTGTRYEIPKRRRRRATRCFGWRRAISWRAPGYGATSCPHQRRDVGCDRAGEPGQSGEWPQSTPRPSKASAAKQSSPSANSKLRNSRTIPCAISRTRGPLSIARRLDCFAQARNDGGKVTTNSFTRLPWRARASRSSPPSSSVTMRLSQRRCTIAVTLRATPGYRLR